MIETERKERITNKREIWDHPSFIYNDANVERTKE